MFKSIINRLGEVRTPWIYAFLIGAAGALLAASPAGERLEENFGLRALFGWRGARPIDADVAIVAIRRAATERLWVSSDIGRNNPCADVRVSGTELAGYARLPVATRLATWPRCVHGHLIEALNDAGATAIVFDLLFRARDQSVYGFDVLADDAALAQAMQRANNVVIAHKLQTESPLDPANPAAGIDTTLTQLSVSIHAAAIAAAPLPLPEAREEIHRVHLFVDADPPLPSLPAVALHAYAARGESLIFPNPPLSLPLLMRAAQYREQLQDDAAAADAQRRIESESDPVKMRDATRLLALYRGANERHINFYGPAGSIPTFGYDDALAGNPETQRRLKGKVVFVGYAEPQQAEPLDDHRTVFSRGGANLHGVEIAATVFANLASDSFLKSVPHWLAATIAAFIGFVTTVTCWRLRTSRGLMLVALAEFLYLAVAAISFKLWHWWLPWIIPLVLLIPAGVIVANALRYREAVAQSDRLERAFLSFVPPSVVKRLTQNAEALHTMRREVNAACLATDAYQYTALAERLGPRALVDFLNDYYEPMFRAVAEHGGFVSDVVGDSMLAIWPEGLESAPTRKQVCEACLQLIAGVDQLVHRSEEPGLITRVGIAWGPIVLAPVGALNRYEYRGVGDAVNTSNRLQSLAKQLGVRIVVSDTLIAGLAEFTTRDLGDYLLRGKSAPERVHELIGRRTQVNETTLSLCDRYAAALAELREGHMAKANAAFDQLRRDFPDDVPTRLISGFLDRGSILPKGVIPVR